jgi:hypothetical protein
MDPETIEIRSLDGLNEFQACVDLQCETWGEGFSDVVPPSLLKVAQRVGGVVLGAFGPDRNLVGFVFGLTASSEGASSTGPTCSPYAQRLGTSASDAASRRSSERSFASSG